MKNFCLEMLSNECFQGTQNAEPVPSPCRVPGKPHPPLCPGQATYSLLETWGSVPSHPVPSCARRDQTSSDPPGNQGSAVPRVTAAGTSG